MTDETRSVLRHAFDAIEAGDLDTARRILEPILAADPDNADAWWIYSHAVTDPEKALDALENVVRVDPNYPDAGKLLTTLRERLPRRAPAAPPPPAPVDMPDLPAADEPDFDIEQTPPRGVKAVTEQPAAAPPVREPEEEEQPRRSLIPILAALLLIVVIAALLLSLLSGGGTTTPTPTSAAVANLDLTDVGAQVVVPETTSEFEPTVTPTLESLAVATEVLATIEVAQTEAVVEAVESLESVEAPVTDEPSADVTAAPGDSQTPPAADSTAESAAPGDTLNPTQAGGVGALSAGSQEALLAAVSRYTLAEQPITLEETTLGNTALVSVCAPDRREVPRALRPVMRAIATAATALDDDVQAVGARMLDCATGRTFVVMAVDRGSAINHAAGTLAYVDFRANWQPQR